MLRPRQQVLPPRPRRINTLNSEHELVVAALVGAVFERFLCKVREREVRAI